MEKDERTKSERKRNLISLCLVRNYEDDQIHSSSIIFIRHQTKPVCPPIPTPLRAPFLPPLPPFPSPPRSLFFEFPKDHTRHSVSHRSSPPSVSRPHSACQYVSFSLRWSPFSLLPSLFYFDSCHILSQMNGMTATRKHPESPVLAGLSPCAAYNYPYTYPDLPSHISTTGHSSPSPSPPPSLLLLPLPLSPSPPLFLSPSPPLPLSPSPLTPIRCAWLGRLSPAKRNHQVRRE